MPPQIAETANLCDDENNVEEGTDSNSDLETIAGNLSKPLELFADILKENTHQIAEEIRHKKTDSPKSESEAEEYVEAEIIDDEVKDASDGAKTVYIQSQTNIAHQTVNNFDLKNAHGITFNL